MKEPTRPGPRLIDRLALAAIVTIALLFRVVPPYGQVIHADRVVFAGNDPWVHMRSADNIAAHWPLPSWFDPYRLGPEGGWIEAPLMDIVVSGIARATRIPIDVVGAWFPAVAGALVPIPVFLLMRRLFGRAEAVIAALLTAILPGQLLQRSLLGQTDHHVLEALLAATVLLFLVRALERQANRDIAITGMFLGLYLLAWSRGAFLLLILLAWAFIQILSGRSAFRMTRVIVPSFAIALLVAAPAAIRLPAMTLTMPILIGGALGIAAAEGLMSRIPRREMAVGALVLLGVASAVIAFFALPDLFTQLRRFEPTGGSASVGEVQPLLFFGGRFTPQSVWFELTTASVLALVGLVMLALAVFRDRSPSKLLVLVWSVVTIGATFAQARFGYYMAISAAMLAALASVRLLARGLQTPFAVLAIAAIVIYPNVPLALATAAAPTNGPSAAWLEALDWIRVHTPEPFGSPDEYVARHQSEAGAPHSGYGVMVWWDYGWWVTRIARRPPSTNPTQAAVKEAGLFYTATREPEALEILRQRNARYVIVDRSMPMNVASSGHVQASQLELMARWAERAPSAYYDVYSEHGQPVFIYSPDYYRTMAIRLYAYAGKGYTPSRSTWAIAVNDRKEITGSRVFETYEEGKEFVAKDPRRWRLAGRHPLLSCVPIEPLSRFERDFSSSQGLDGPIGRIPEVAVFHVNNP